MPSPVPAHRLPRKSPWRLHVSSITTLLKRVWTSSYEDGVYNRAAELAYFFFLSLFPGVIFITTLLGLIFKSNTQLTVLLLRYLGTTLPGTAFALIRQVIIEITRSSGSGKLTFGILAALWTANSGMNALEDTLNDRCRSSRPSSGTGTGTTAPPRPFTPRSSNRAPRASRSSSTTASRGKQTRSGARFASGICARTGTPDRPPALERYRFLISKLVRESSCYPARHCENITNQQLTNRVGQRYRRFSNSFERRIRDLR